jgi:hypothetical protein
MVVPTAGTITLQEVTYTQLLIEHLAKQQYTCPPPLIPPHLRSCVRACVCACVQDSCL